MKKIILNSKIKIVSKAEASFGNPYINKINFILTDDQPNANGVGIRREDFLDFAKSALFMPIKMTAGDIEGHPDSSPVGVITEAEVETEKILGSGILWPEERPADVALIRDKTEKGEAQISWEVGYSEDVTDDDGKIWLLSPKLLAATLVKYPAYMGRTPVVSFSSTEEEKDMPNENEEILETPEVVETEEVKTPEVETPEETDTPAPELVENPETPEVEEPEDEPEVVEPEVEEPALTDEQLQELEDLRTFKRRVERGKIVTKTLGEDLDENTVNVLVDLTDEQLQVVKKLVSSRKVENSSRKETPEIPAVIPTQHQEFDAAQIVLNALRGEK